MQNVTIYKVNNLSYAGKRNVEAGELEEKHKKRLEELADEHKEGFEKSEMSES